MCRLILLSNLILKLKMFIRKVLALNAFSTLSERYSARNCKRKLAVITYGVQIKSICFILRQNARNSPGISYAKLNINITNRKLETLRSLLSDCKCSVGETACENVVHLFILIQNSYLRLE